VRTNEELQTTLRKLDGRGYKAYRDLHGAWDLGVCVLIVDHVQGDPFAGPSRVRLQVSPETAALRAEWYEGRARSVALRDFLARRTHEACRRFGSERRGTGHSGEIRIDAPGQEVLETSAVVLTAKGGVEARLTVGLPAQGRRVAGRQAAVALTENLPAIAEAALMAEALDTNAVWRHLTTVEDARDLRSRLPDLGLVAFLADGAILPRRSGVDERPLPTDRAVPLRTPEALRVGVDLPHAGLVTGLGIPRGVTLVVGGGYHGKSTLLEAVQRGVYDHIPGDGRELVVTDADAVKIRAEDGRRVEGVDISPFIDDLPGGHSTRAFRSDDASGSTSQAASIVEAMEAGATALLMDEDTSATNFLIRDARMQALVAPEHEPITPFVDRVRQLWEDRGISTVLVLGGSGDYLDVADTVIALRDFEPHEVTEEARRVAADHPTRRTSEGLRGLLTAGERRPVGESLDPRRGRRDVKITCRGLRTIVFGTHEIDLVSLEQLVHPAQTRSIGEALVGLRGDFEEGETSVAEALDRVEAALEKDGPDALARREPRGDLAAFRRLELAAALNRLRTLRIR
jgi:predicted ABC-class ATPase